MITSKKQEYDTVCTSHSGCLTCPGLPVSFNVLCEALKNMGRPGYMRLHWRSWPNTQSYHINEFYIALDTKTQQVEGFRTFDNLWATSTFHNWFQILSRVHELLMLCTCLQLLVWRLYNLACFLRIILSNATALGTITISWLCSHTHSLFVTFKAT